MKAAQDLASVRRRLVQHGQLEAHTLFVCPGCDERQLGQPRCQACGHFCCALGLAVACTACSVLAAGKHSEVIPGQTAALTADGAHGGLDRRFAVRGKVRHILQKLDTVLRSAGSLPSSTSMRSGGWTCVVDSQIVPRDL